MEFEANRQVATHQIHEPCPYCAAEGMLRITQSAIHGALRWYEWLNCQKCQTITESGGGGLPPDAIRERLLSEHGEWALLLESISSTQDAAKTLRQNLGLDSRDALQRVRAGHSQGVFSGTRVECEWLADKLTLSSEHQIVQRRTAPEGTLPGDPVA